MDLFDVTNVSVSESLDKKLHDELEQKTQELFQAQKTIEVLTSCNEHLESDNVDLKKEVDLLRSVQEHSSKGQHEKESMCRVYKQQLNDTQVSLEEAQASVKEKDKELAQQKQLVQQLTEQLLQAATAAASVSLDGSDVDNLQQQISGLEAERNAMKEKLLDAACESQELRRSLEHSRQQVEELEVEMEGLQCQFTSQCNINQHLREENEEHRVQAQLQAETTAAADTSRKGNSLFSEVDDRRVIAETRMVDLQRRIQMAEEKLIIEQNENKKLKRQVLVLRQSTSKGYDEKTVRELQRQLEGSKKTVLSLTEELKNRPSQSGTDVFKMPPVTSGSDTDEHFINYLHSIISLKQKQLDSARADAQDKQRQSLQTDLHLTRTKNELLVSTHECERLKLLNAHLAMEVQSLQQKNEPESCLSKSKEKIKIPLQDKASDFNSSSRENREVDNSHTHARENTELPGTLHPGKMSKTVRMNETVKTVSSGGDQMELELKDESISRQTQRKDRRKAKHRNVTQTYEDTAEEATPECKQQ